MNPIIISVEGIVGAGKTTFVKFLAKHLNAIICEEPVAKWREIGLLEKFLNPDSMERWAFTFQIEVLNDAIQSLVNCVELSKQSNGRQIIIIDRSIYADKCFVEVLKENNKLSQVEYNLYQDIWNKLEGTIGKEIYPDLFIYLRPPVEECMKRIKLRGRNEEKDMTIEYQEKLQKYHDLFINNQTKVTIIDNTSDKKDIRKNEIFRINLIQKIQELI